MLPGTLIKGFDKGRLRNLLALFFLALAVPTGALIWQAYSQLKWEAFHQYRGLAENLTGRVDAQLIDMIDTADARSYADYTFLNVTGETRFNFVQRSPLSAYPVTEDLPGVIGYFQVDTHGAFTTPLLPPEGTDAEKLGIGRNEFNQRLQLAQEIQAILADNRLVQPRPGPGLRRDLNVLPAAARTGLEEAEKEADDFTNGAFRSRQLASVAEPEAAAIQTVSLAAELQGSIAGGFLDQTPADKDAVDELEAKQRLGAASADVAYSQQAFDQLNQPRENLPVSSAVIGTPEFDNGTGEAQAENERLNTIGKLADLKLDAALQKKSESIERTQEAQRSNPGRAAAPSRAKRREQIALPETAPPADRQTIQNVAGLSDLRISTFESEIDPLEFSLLDSGHFVLFRNVWREGERYIQGLLVDQNAFVSAAIERAFYDSPLSAMSNLIVGYQDDVIRFYPGPANSSYPGNAGEMQGALLYSNRLSTPLDSLELIFSINRLPPGPGATLLGWVTFVLAMVFAGGFLALYRLGVSQINLARQQQDFVSAVSHELKTPLTSIRMYGEMLKEGWADEEKRQSYYEFIHDESERLTRMISNVLQLANITHNEPNFDLKRINVGELMSNIESKIANQVERADFELNFNRNEDADNATINIDGDCFAQIIINLVDNAIKFSKNADNKMIDIGSKLTGDKQIQFTVRDHGPGIPRDQMKKIFRLFYRTESELTRETVGTGIGLAIVHQLTTAMHGKVDVVNAKPGAEFRISFPTCET
ncbi:MAG: HAMP domain-containing histidine kinase [Proteobacteria bacterium]|nr:HAMP domain-containing histidine kinase [Pseudomonadota bacterium]